ncbi:hypothetical protein GCM10027047_35570 [Rhodococcus aerolatus]
MQASADALDGRVRALLARVDALLAGGWSSQAADAFRRDVDQRAHGAHEVIGGLDTTAGLLTDNAHAYAGTERTNAAGLDQSGSSLDLGA